MPWLAVWSSSLALLAGLNSAHQVEKKQVDKPRAGNNDFFNFGVTQEHMRARGWRVKALCGLPLGLACFDSIPII